MFKWLRGCAVQIVFVLVFGILIWMAILLKLATEK